MGTSLVAVLLSTGFLMADGPRVDFERDVLPIFKAQCYRCHDARKQRAGYRLDVRSRALKGGESGRTALVPGDAAGSELIRRLTAADDDKAMPPDGKRL